MSWGLPPAPRATRPFGALAASAPAPARLRPLDQVVDGAEAVRDAVLAAVPDEHHADVPERLGAACAFPTESTAPPGISSASQCGPLHRPGNDVLEPTERGSARAWQLVQSPAVVALDRAGAPGAAIAVSRE